MNTVINIVIDVVSIVVTFTILNWVWIYMDEERHETTHRRLAAIERLRVRR